MTGGTEKAGRRIFRGELWAVVALVLGLAGCGGTDTAEPPERDEKAVRREWLFGPEAAKPGIVWQEDGLGLRILAPGSGVSPGPADRVRVQFVAKIKDGTVIEDSHTKGPPQEFVLGKLIPGWAEGMAALKPGGHAILLIPPSLGYGTGGGGGLPAGAGLIFDVELIEVVPAEKK